MNRCNHCSLELARADTGMLRYWLAETGSRRDAWAGRLADGVTLVCPRCDSYALGAELQLGLPFHSQAIGAFATVHDWDWANREPGECDIGDWPDFACLTLSEAALRSTLAYIGSGQAGANKAEPTMPPSESLMGPTGIPEGPDATLEWTRQLRALQQRMQDVPARDLDESMRLLARILA